MRANVLSQPLSPTLLSTLRTHWLVDDCSIASGDADRRIRAYQAVAREIASRAERQLIACNIAAANDRLKHRALITGYISGMSEAVLRECGEASLWAIAFTHLSAMLTLLGPEGDEDQIGAEAHRLWTQRNSEYLAGLCAADTDHTALRHQRMTKALTAAIIEREK